MRLRAPLTALAAAAVLALPACGGDDGADSASGVDPSATAATPEARPSASPKEPAVPAEVPTPDVPPGPPPTELQVTEVTEGTGEVAEPGDLVAVDYAGYLYSQPDQPFDQSYTRGQPLEFQVGGGVIEGFSQGVAGMRVGGRRQVVIPPDLGYGAQGVGPIPPNATLVFVLDLRAVQSPTG